MGGDHHEGFSQLSEEQKKRVRKAMDQAWGRPEVKEARDRVMRANDDLRRTLSKVLLEIDPDLQPLLEKLRPSRSRDGRGSMGPLPDPKAPDFAKQTVRRLESELMTFTPMERREGARELHARILGLPRVKEVFAQLEQAPMEQRVEAAEKFRAAYREVLGEEIRRLRGEAGGKGGPPGAGGETGIRRAPPSGEEGKKREAP